MNKKKEMECPLCGNESLVYKSGEYTIRDPKSNKVAARVPSLEWDECLECGERFLDDEAMDRIEEVKYRLRGLLLPKKLKAIRESLGLTQIQIAKILKVGDKSYFRWENGLSVQTKAHDNLIRLIIRNPKKFIRNEDPGQKSIEKPGNIARYIEQIKELQGAKFSLAAYGHPAINNADKKLITEVLRKKKEEKLCQE